MTVLARMRHRRWLPRAVLALFVLALGQMTLMPCVMASQAHAAMSEHCAYCPDSTDTPAACAYPDDAHMDVASHAPTLVAPLLAIFHWPALRSARAQSQPPPAPPQARSFILLHCVQLK